jgi:hypothetical protein
MTGTGWQNITPTDPNGGSLGASTVVQLDPTKPGTIYVQMHRGGNGNHYPTDGLYVSDDCGSTWSRVPQGRNASDGDGGTSAVNVYSGSFASLIIDPMEPTVFFAVSNYGPGGIWKSTDAGVDWDQMLSPTGAGQYVAASWDSPGHPGMWFNALEMEATDHLHLVGATHTGCIGAFAPNCLLESRDGGITWNAILAPAVGSNEANGVYILNATTMLYGTPEDGLYLTTNDDGATSAPAWTKVGQGVSGAGSGYPPYRSHAACPGGGSPGCYFVASPYGVVASPDFLSWATVPNSPPCRSLVGTGTNLYATDFNSFTYWTAPESQPTSWPQVDAGGAPIGDNGGVYIVYEGQHHLLYTSNFDVGLWRLATL